MSADPEFDRTPPHDIAAEQCVLGGMMLSRDALADVLEILHPGDHYRPAHTLVHEAILSQYNAGEPADAVSVAATLTRQGDIGKMGGAPYLHTLIASVPTAANAGYYARIVREHAVKRRLTAAGTRIAQLGYDAGATSPEAVERAYEAMDDVAGDTPKTAAVAVSEVAADFLADLEDGKRGPTGIPVPWVDLNYILGGLHPGQLIVWAGRPGMGKSIALERCATHAVRAGLRVLVVSLEMSRMEYLQRIYAAEAQVSLFSIRNREIDQYDWDKLARVHARIAGMDRLLIHEGPSMTVQDIRTELRGMARAGRPADLVAIDYLQLLTPGGRRNENRQAEVSEMSRGLKLLAKEFGIPVLLGAQLNRGPETRSDHRPMVADLRESGSIEQDADVVVLLHREDAYDRVSPRAGEIDLIVGKNRQGPQTTVTAAFQGHYAKIADMARIDAPSQDAASDARYGEAAA